MTVHLGSIEQTKYEFSGDLQREKNNNNGQNHPRMERHEPHAAKAKVASHGSLVQITPTYTKTTTATGAASENG